MKTVAMFAGCFAVASVAVAAESKLKDPTQLALEWQKTIQEAGDGLKASPTLLPDKPRKQLATDDGHFLQRPSDDFTPKAKNFRIPPNWIPGTPDQQKPHPRAKEWNYRGQTYWIVPLTA